MSPNGFLGYHMMGILQKALCLDCTPGQGSTLSRGQSTSTTKLSSSVALAPLQKERFWDLSGANHAPKSQFGFGSFSSGRRLQTKQKNPYKDEQGQLVSVQICNLLVRVQLADKIHSKNELFLFQPTQGIQSISIQTLA